MSFLGGSMLKVYCDQCGTHTWHSADLCLVCYPAERTLRLMREDDSVVETKSWRDWDDENEKPSPVRLPALE